MQIINSINILKSSVVSKKIYATISLHRGLGKSGNPPVLGTGEREFESRIPDIDNVSWPLFHVYCQKDN